jgi:hypothetical protein
MNYLAVIFEFWKENWPFAIPFLILALAAVILTKETK